MKLKLSLFAWLIAFAAMAAPSRPNILWIITDDMGPEVGCYGHAGARTPNIDKLATQGARYTRCYTTAPVCSPSRSAIMTAMYQTTINAHQHRSMAKLPPDVLPITDHFRKAGYFTCNIKNTGTDLKSGGKMDFNFEVENPFDGEDFTELKDKQPFFAEFQIIEPHRGSWKQGRQAPYAVDPAKVEVPPYYPDHPLVREDWAGYVGAINYLDTKVGQILRLLEESGLAENTVVFFFADNGRCHVWDKQWLTEGGLHIPLIVRWPGQIKPGTVKDDLVSTIDISATSLRIAGVDLSKNMQGQVFLGRDARKREYIFGARDRCDETEDRIRSVRDDRYKYIRNFMPERPYTQPNAYKKRQYPVLSLLHTLHAEGKLTPAQARFMAPTKPAEELYDLEKDPYELENLADSAKHQKIKAKLKAAMEKWMTECDDRPGKEAPPRGPR